MRQNIQNRNDRMESRLQLCLLFAAAGIFAFFLPYTCDDWIWGTDYAVTNYLSNWFEGYNGRYVGNLIVMTMTRSHLVRVLLMAGCIIGLVWLMGRLIGRSWAVGLSVMLLLFLPKEIFSQTFAWTSGFANYVVSALPTLFLLYRAQRLFREVPVLSKNALCRAVLTGLVMFLGSLIMENITIYNVLLGMVLLFFYYKKYRKISPDFLLALAGSISAALWMFSNPAYGLISRAEDVEIRSRTILSFSGILETVLDAWNQKIYLLVFRNHTVLLIGFAAVLLLLHYRNRRKMSGRTRIAADVSLTFFLLYVTWELLLRIVHGTNTLYGPLQILDAAVTAAAIAAFITSVWLESRCVGKMAEAVFWTVSIAVFTGPLFVVNPVSARCFLIQYIYLILLLAELVKGLLSELPESLLCPVRELSVRIGLLILLGEVLFYGYIYGSNSAADRKRLEYVREQIDAGENTVTLYQLPYPSYLFVSTPYDAWTQSVSQYKEFYGIPQEITLVYENPQEMFRGVTLDRENLIFESDQPIKLEASADIPYESGAQIRWSSSDPAVAVVDEEGTVTPLAYGSCTITASVDGEAYAASCSVKVPWLAKSAWISAESQVDGVLVSWAKVEDALGYMLYSQQPGKEFELLAYIPEKDQVTYFDPSASLSEHSYYYVFPVGNINGMTVMGLKTDEYAYATRGLAKIRTFQYHNNKAGDVVLTWSEVAAADGYIIQVKRGTDGAMTELADVPAGIGAYCIDTEAPKEEMSYYWITPYKKNQSGERILGTTNGYIKAYSKRL